MDKIIRMTGIVAALATIAISILYLVKGIMIPGASAFGLAIVMGSLLYSTRKNYLAGKVEKGRWRLILILASLAMIMNVIAGIAQIQTALGH